MTGTDPSCRTTRQEKSSTAACFLPIWMDILVRLGGDTVVALTEVVADLADESAWLDAAVQGLDDAAWNLPTPAPGWTIAHQIAHLTWTDGQAFCSATDPEAFAVTLNQMLTGEVTIDGAAAEGSSDPPSTLLRSWRQGRADLARALEALPAGTRLPWFMTTMSPTSMATGPDAERWLDIAQAFAGPPGAGRKPRA
ncbi:MAG: maleylpyruvate isomerase N-terminal domain-containing protein [Streptosporangiaceae bacterium]|jgi:mycothiol maleylpyruvate isomerase-like protein